MKITGLKIFLWSTDFIYLFIYFVFFAVSANLNWGQQQVLNWQYPTNNQLKYLRYIFTT